MTEKSDDSDISRPYEKLILVCTQGKSCPRQGGAEICSKLREQVFQAGQKNRIRVVKSGCLAQCGHGPIVAVEPEGTWFSAVQADHCEKLADWILNRGALPEGLIFDPPEEGKNILPEADWRIPPQTTGEAGNSAI